MLQGEETVVHELSDRKSRRVDPEDPTSLSHVVILPRRLPPPDESENAGPLRSAL